MFSIIKFMNNYNPGLFSTFFKKHRTCDWNSFNACLLLKHLHAYQKCSCTYTLNFYLLTLEAVNLEALTSQKGKRKDDKDDDEEEESAQTCAGSKIKSC